MSVAIDDVYSWGKYYNFYIAERSGNKLLVKSIETSWMEWFSEEELLGAYWAPHKVDNAVAIPEEVKSATVIVKTSEDVVNHPSHYKFANGVEVIALTEQLNFNCGNVVKYTARAGRKDASKQLEDLRKAEFYIKREIARVENLGEDF